MLYNFFRFCLWILYRAYYRRIYYLGKSNIPQKAPTFFVSNHSNGFMDPILIASMHWRPVYFWTRATEFSAGIKAWLLLKLHALPIYRIAEGKENMHKNEETFRQTREALYQGNTAYVAPEGTCKLEKYLRPLKTGTARLAFKIMEEKNWDIDVKIVPVGLNYSYANRFRSEAYVNVGAAINLKEYKARYKEDPNAAAYALTEDIRQGIQGQMVYIKEEDEELTGALLPMLRNNFTRGARPFYVYDPEHCQREQALANAVTALEESEKSLLKEVVVAYEAALKAAGQDDYAVAGQNKRSFFWILLGAPVGLLGTLFGHLPHIWSRNLRNKIVPYPEFATSFAFVVSLIIWGLWGIVWTSVAAFFVGWWALLLPVVMVWTQVMAYHYVDYYKEWKALQAYKNYSDKVSLEQQRAAISLLNEF